MDGKVVESWRASWWDFYPLLERPRRALEWSQSSVIFTAHPTQPSILGRHFSSSKQFELPTPLPIANFRTSYDPPSLISASPDDEWLLAYFPRRDSEGTACLWKRGPQIDSWHVREYWGLPKGGGIVAVSWLGNRREWVPGPTGVPTRLPVRGPPVPVADTTLLYITQDNHVYLSFLRHYIAGMRVLKRSIVFAGLTKETSTIFDYSDNANNTRQCVEASFGIGYNEQSIFLATHCRRVPPPTTLNASEYDPVNLSVTGNLTSDQRSIEWENWGEERTIDLYEVQILFDGTQMGLKVQQLSTLDCPPLSLSGLTFICTPPPLNTLAPPAEAMMSPTQAKLNSHPPDKGKIGLIASYINFHEYSKPPTSTLTLYSLAPRPVANNRSNIWAVQQTSTRLIDSGVVTYVEPFVDFSGPNTVLMYACILDTSGSSIKAESPSKEISIGTLKVLNIPSLADNTNWGSTPIKSSIGALGKDLPLFSTLSPNRRLFCTLSSSLWQTQTAVYSLPLPDTLNILNTRLPLAIATAILGRSSTSDLIHAICSPAIPVSEAVIVLYQTLDILDNHYQNYLSPNTSTWSVLGIATEIFRTKALLTKHEQEAETLRNRWETAHDIYLLAACVDAFEECNDGGGTYDLEAVWQLIGLCTWVVGLIEKLMKACVLSSNATLVAMDGAQPDASNFEILSLPILLHLSHPFTLNNILMAVRHVKAFRSFLGSFPAGSEHSRIAQDVLVDVVDCSGVDLGSLISLLEEYLDALRKMDSQECRKALAACQPTITMRLQLSKLLQRISESESLLNKSTLFIKPSDLIDGVARLSLASQPRMDETDVVSKALLLKQEPKDVCLRCGGQTAMNRDLVPRGPKGQFHSKWHLFELKWQLRCLCGGSWSLPYIS